MGRNKIMLYGLLLALVLLGTMAIASVGDAQARYINTDSWYTSLTVEPTGQVTSNCLIEGGQTVLLGQMALEELEVPFTLNADQTVSGVFDWEIKETADYLQVGILLEGTAIAENTSVTMDKGESILDLQLIPTETALNTIHKALTMTVTVRWIMQDQTSISADFQVTLPAVEKLETPTDPDTPSDTEDPSETPEETEQVPSETPEETEQENGDTAQEQQPAVASETDEPSESTDDTTGTPDDTTETPDDTTDSPGDNTEIPDDSTDTPGDSTETPGDNTDTPGDGTETPGDNTDTPGDGTDTPGDDTETPDDSTETPGDSTETPGDNTETPDDTTQTPDDSTSTPVEPDSEVEGASAVELSSLTVFYREHYLPVIITVPQGSTRVILTGSMTVEDTQTDDTQTDDTQTDDTQTDDTQTPAEQAETEALSQLPAFTRYSPDGGSTWYLLYHGGTIELNVTSGTQIGILLDLSGAGGLDVLDLQAQVYAGETPVGTAEHTARMSMDSVITSDPAPWLLSDKKRLVLRLDPAWSGCELEYTVELLTADEKLEQIGYVPVTLSEDSLYAVRDTSDTADTLTFRLGEEEPPLAGSYRITFTWKYEELCFATEQTSFFINYSSD